MLPQRSKANLPYQNNWRPSIHFGSLDAILSFLAKHQSQEKSIKSILSPWQTVAGDGVRHHAVHLSTCVYHLDAAPIAYATFLAASVKDFGRVTRVVYPRLEPSDPLGSIPANEAVWTLQASLYTELHSMLIAQKQVVALDLVEDSQWDVPNAWSSAAKGFMWKQGAWTMDHTSASSIFTIGS